MLLAVALLNDVLLLVDLPLVLYNLGLMKNSELLVLSSYDLSELVQFILDRVSKLVDLA